MNKLEIKINNFIKALQRLEEAADELYKEKDSAIVRDALIQRFEFTYELAWKTTKDYLESLGIMDKNSPKAVIQEAYLQRLILNEDSWLAMIKDRNMTSHLYKEELAKEISKRIIDTYI
ncbi:MAG: nucleotidyltransferase, partial [Clostridiales bacterium]|nr:nucleotidyltransferase [Clostridiales bacterium]